MSHDAKRLGWVICANISDHLRSGREKGRFYQGTPKFSAGTKVYLGEPFRGMGSMNLRVAGLHRMERCWISCIIATNILAKIRPYGVYSGRKWQTLRDNGVNCFDDKATALLFMEEIISAAEHERPEKLKTSEIQGPWGKKSIEAYRIDDPSGPTHPNPINAAAQFAQTAHEGQLRKGAALMPYITHPAEVAEIVREYGGGDAAIIAAWLHDTVEDTDVTLYDIERHFGPRISSLVDELTDNPTLTKAQQHQAQIDSAAHMTSTAALVKAADQLSNVRSLRLNPPDWPRAQIQAYVKKASAVLALLKCSDYLKSAFQNEAKATLDFWETRSPPLPD